jgi:hypothetical protein
VKRSDPPIVGRHLVIVHNVDSGLRNRLAATWKRLRHPHAAPCALCGLTRGVRGTNPTWQAHLDTLSEPVHSQTRDQFRADHASSSWRNIGLPVILVQTGTHIDRVVSAAEIRKSTTVKELIEKLDAGLAAHPAQPKRPGK